MKLGASALALFLAAAVTAAGPARAQSDAALRDALDRFQEGMDAAAVANETGSTAKWEEARVKFLEAYAVVRRPSLVYNLAYSEERLGRGKEAVDHYREYLAFADKPKEAEARKRMAALLDALGQRQPEAPEHSPVTVDGAAVPGEPPFRETVVVKPGAHVVVARVGPRRAEKTVQVGAGQTERVTLELPETSERRQPSLRKILTTGGLAAVAVGAFITAGVMKAQEGSAASRQSELKGQEPANACALAPSDRCTELLVVGQDRERYDIGAGVALGVGLALAGGAVATWFLWPNTEPVSEDNAGPRQARAIRVVPTLGGALVEGRF